MPCLRKRNRKQSERELVVAVRCVQRRFRRQQAARLRRFEACALLEIRRIERRETLARATAATARCSLFAAADAATATAKASKSVAALKFALQAAKAASLAAATAADRACVQCCCDVDAAVRRQLAQRAAADAAAAAAAIAAQAARVSLTSVPAAEIAAARAFSNRAHTEAALQLQVLARRWLQQRATKAISGAVAMAAAAAAASAAAADIAADVLIPPLPPLQPMLSLRREVLVSTLPITGITTPFLRRPRRAPILLPPTTSLHAPMLPKLSLADRRNVDDSTSVGGALAHDMLVAQGMSWDEVLQHGLHQQRQNSLHKVLWQQQRQQQGQQPEPRSRSPNMGHTGQGVQLLGQRWIRVGVGQWTNQPKLAVGDSQLPPPASVQFPVLQ